MRGAAPTFDGAVPRRALLKAVCGALAVLTLAACARREAGSTPTESADEPRYAAEPGPLSELRPSFAVAGASSASAPSGKKMLLFQSDAGQVSFVRSNLVATGLFAAADIAALGITSTPPTLAELSAYDCVLAWTNAGPANPAGNGDRLREYADAGGGVVLMAFAYSPREDPWELQGGIMADGYSPLDISTTRESVFPRSLDFSTALVSDPILEGVTDFTYGGSSNYLALTLDQGATLVASDDFGIPLIAISRSRRVAGINLYPGNSFAKSAGVWRAIANACIATSKPAVVNHAPTASIADPDTTDDSPATPYAVAEGSAVSLAASAADPDGDALAYLWDFDGDGVTDDTALAASHVYADDGTFAARLIVTDAAGASDTATATVVVSNVAPTLDAGPDVTVAAGQPFSLAGTFADPGASDGPWRFTIDWGDAGGAATGGSLTSTADRLVATHRYAAPGRYVVQISLADKDGGSATDEVVVTVENHLPVAAIAASSSGSEGQAVVFDGGGSSDPDGDGIASYAWDFGDGTTGSGALTAHAYADEGAYTVTLVVTDARGGVSAPATARVAVGNVAPTVAPMADTTVLKRTTFSTAVSFSDPGVGDAPWSYVVSWGDGSANASGSVTGASIPLTHVFRKGGSYTVVVSVTDEDGATGSASFTVTVVNRSPNVSSSGGPYTVVEGAPLVFQPRAFDPDQDPLAYVWSFGDGAAGSGTNPTHIYRDDSRGPFTASITVTDDEGLAAAAAVPVTVLNAPPVLGDIRGLPTGPVPAGTVVRVSAGFTDAGSLDTHVGSVVWSAGARAEPAAVSEGAGAGTVTASKALPAGIHTVTLRVTDDDGGSASVASSQIVVFDPAAGFVSGGGWFDVPAGGPRSRGMRGGRVRFEVDARYRGAAPRGKLEMKIEGSRLEFESSSLRWLVVAGGRAWCEGEGKVNGVPGYRFALVATDGDARGGRGDLLRVRITGPGGVVYDNGTGALDSATGTPLGGGNITVHQ